MTMTPTNQNLIRDLVELLKARGLRHAAHAGNAASDEFVLGSAAGGATLPNNAGKIYFYLELDSTVLATLDEKGWGSLHPHVPSSTRQ